MSTKLPCTEKGDIADMMLLTIVTIITATGDILSPPN